MFFILISFLFTDVNGIMFNGQKVQVCKDDVTFWHLANVGTQSDFLSVYFTGNPFMKDNVYESVLTLFPMSGETVTMETELIGKVKGQMILLQLYSVGIKWKNIF